MYILNVFRDKLVGYGKDITLTCKVFTEKLFCSKNDVKYEEDILEDQNQQISFENEALQFWKIFFDFSFNTLLTPFRFSWDGVSGLYSCKCHFMQRLLQWSLYSCTTLYFLFKLWKLARMEPPQYFQVVYYFFDTTFLVVLFVSLGRHAKLISQVFSDIQTNNYRLYKLSRNARKTRLIAATICMGCLGTLLLQILETLLDNDWSITKFADYWNQDAAWTFGDNIVTRNCPNCLGILGITSSLFEKLLNAFSDILFTMTVLMWNNLVLSFYLDMKNVEIHEPMEILEHYWWLKYITDEMNSATNLINVAFVARNLPFYATNVFDIFGDANVFKRLRYMFYCSYWYPSLFIAAHANSKLEYVKDWVYKEENYSRIPDQKLRVFLTEIHYDTVGIGSFGIITFTWNSVALIISIIIAYALLNSQLGTNLASKVSTGEDGMLGNFSEIKF